VCVCVCVREREAKECMHAAAHEIKQNKIKCDCNDIGTL
jgi:hypothetical protein